MIGYASYWPVLGSETAVLWQYWSQTGLGLGLLVLYFWTFWSCFQHCCAREALCDMIMLKCNILHCEFDALCHHFNKAFMYVCIFVPVKRNWSSYHFLTFFCTKLFFDNKRACCNRRVFCYVVLLLLNWSWSWYWSWSLVSITTIGTSVCLVCLPVCSLTVNCG